MDNNENKKIDTDIEQEVPTITTKIGSTIYVVGVHFSKTSKETQEDKIKRMAIEECERKISRRIFDKKILDKLSLEGILNVCPSYFLSL